MFILLPLKIHFVDVVMKYGLQHNLPQLAALWSRSLVGTVMVIKSGVSCIKFNVGRKCYRQTLKY